MVEIITIRVENCVFEISLEHFFDIATFTKQKQLLRYVLQEPWRNEATIARIDAFLPQMRNKAKSDWHDASVKFQNEYRLNNPRNNNTLLNTVKRTKTKFDRCDKLIKFYDGLKAKNGIK